MLVVAMAPERLGHARAKANIWRLFRAAIATMGLSCEAIPEGLAIAVDESDYLPDCIVRCGDPLPVDVMAVPDPMIVVEVLSPSTARYDRATKFVEYFRVASVRHYLIVWPDMPRVVHHRRINSGGVETMTVTSGDIVLDPPGITIMVQDIYTA